MRLDDHFGSGSTLQRNERVKLAATFWNNVGAGMVIAGMAGAFFLDKPPGAWAKIGIAIGGLVLGWLCYSIASHVPAHTTRGASLSRVAASDEQTRGREDNPRDECCQTGEQQKVVDDVGHDAPRAPPQANGLPDPKHMTIPWPKRGSARQVR